jgi:hypothetical protein
MITIDRLPRLPMPLAGLLVLLCVPAAALAQPLYRCIENGRTLFTDKPCAGGQQSTVLPDTQRAAPPDRSGPPAKSAAPAARVAPGKKAPPRKPAPPETGDVAELYGAWQGQAAFQATSRGQRVAEAASAAVMTISVGQDGKIAGASPGNGCKVQGVAAPNPNRTLLHVDVALTGCRYLPFNRRFSGTLGYYLKQKNAQMSLQSANTMIPAQYDVRATMMR